MRTHTCGDLRPRNIGETVSVCGWVARRREHGEHLAFVDVRDYSGVVQCVVDNAVDVRSEYVVRITGVVRRRPAGTVNANLPTGEVEIGECSIEILRTATPPPFPIDARADEVDENVRLQYRYLDLRRERMQRNLRIRAAINGAVRRAMDAQGFVEVETPMLVPSTPEGARDFLVPSRREPGSFYALPQSPQLFKQLLMIAGFERYYQIVRCFRDEDQRADRQLDFTQLDVELSFVDTEDVLDVNERMLAQVLERVDGPELALPIPRLPFDEAMGRYGTDRPDVRFGLELVDVSGSLRGTEFKVFGGTIAGGGVVKGLNAGRRDLPRSALDGLISRAQELGAKGLVWAFREGDGWRSPTAKFLSTEELRSVNEALGAEEGDLLLLVADDPAIANTVLAQLRLDL